MMRRALGYQTLISQGSREGEKIIKGESKGVKGNTELRIEPKRRGRGGIYRTGRGED